MRNEKKCHFIFIALCKTKQQKPPTSRCYQSYYDFFYKFTTHNKYSVMLTYSINCAVFDDVTKWKHFPRYWLFVRGIHRSLVNSPQKGQWCGALMLSLICAWINRRVNNREAGDLRHPQTLYDVSVMSLISYRRHPHHHPNQIPIPPAKCW